MIRTIRTEKIINHKIINNMWYIQMKDIRRSTMVNQMSSLIMQGDGDYHSIIKREIKKDLLCIQ